MLEGCRAGLRVARCTGLLVSLWQLCNPAVSQSSCTHKVHPGPPFARSFVETSLEDEDYQSQGPEICLGVVVMPLLHVHISSIGTCRAACCSAQAELPVDVRYFGQLSSAGSRQRQHFQEAELSPWHNFGAGWLQQWQLCRALPSGVGKAFLWSTGSEQVQIVARVVQCCMWTRLCILDCARMQGQSGAKCSRWHPSSLHFQMLFQFACTCYSGRL